MDIKDYYPNTVEDIYEFLTLANAEQPIFDNIWQCCENVLNESFIETMGIEGIVRFEKMLGITDTKTDKEERRKDIKAALMGDLPYTLKFLKDCVKNFYGKSASVEVDYENYDVTIRTNGYSKSDNAAFMLFLKKIMPANLIYTIADFKSSQKSFLVSAHSGGYRYRKITDVKRGNLSV